MSWKNTSSSPDFQISRKGSIPALNGSSSSGSTDSFSPSTPTGKMSVTQRARAFEKRAAASQQSAMSPQTSPPPISPFVKSTAVDVQFAVPQVPSRQPSTVPSDGRDTPGDFADETDSSDKQPQESMREENSERISKQQQLTENPVDENGTLPIGTDVPGEEDQDKTPRQSTNYDQGQKKISRQDSSRQANYSLKPQTYSPDSSVSVRQSEPVAPPRLPKLFFEGAAPKTVRSQSSVDGSSPSLSSGVQLNRGSLREEGKGDALAVPDVGYKGQIADSPPLNDEMDASNRSFFWHSPHDSTDETDEEDYVDVRPPTTQRETTLTSATALGFGGPSDWEHFYGGDYQTELIDDTELYLSKKERSKQKMEELAIVKEENPVGSEGPAEGTGSMSIEDQRDISDAKSREIPPLPTIEEARESEEPNIVPQHIDYEFPLDSFARSPPPVTPAIPPTPAALDNANKNPSPDLDSSEYISVERKGPSDETIVGHKDSLETIVQVGGDKAKDEQPVAQEPGQDRNSVTEDAFSTTSALPNGSLPKTPPPSEIKMPQKDNTSGNGLASGPSSPPADDPNASEITISMVLPPDFDPSFLPLQDNSTTKVSPPLRVTDSRKSVFPQSEEQPTPYAGLSPMAKASLNRFIRMLREEEKAESDQDKYYIFTNFSRHEMKLRATLYDMDDESEFSVPPSARASLMSTPNRRKGRSPSVARRKPLPMPPEGIFPMDLTTGRAQSMLASAAGVQSEETVDNDSEGPAKIANDGANAVPQRSSELANDIKQSQTRNTKDGSGETSQDTDGDRSVIHQSSLEILNKSVDLVAPRSSMISDPNAASHQTDSSKKLNSERQSITSSPLPGAQILEVSLSVKSSESRPYDGDKATNRQTIYRPFSGALRSSSSYRRASMESLITVKSADKMPERKGTDPKSLAIAGKAVPAASASLKSTDPNGSHPVRQLAGVDTLLAVIPQNNVLREEHRQLASLRFDMDNIVDDFSFIHKTVLAWDSGAKIKRERYELERQQRMSENERRVEELFNDNEIGYGDISHLEVEFKRSESARKAEEEREEVESFVSSVFDVVWARINYEMDRLTPLYQDATKLVADASAGKQMFEDVDERVPIAPIMEILLILYQKLMIRHQKAFEAVLERDRRLKKTEVSPWFAVGAFDKVKRIEKRFEDAEKKAILEFCRQRDERANSLMDVLDQHTLRGVGANQDYMESVMQVVRRIAVQTAIRNDGSKTEDTKTSMDEVAKAKLVTAALARSSEQIVRNFHVADMLLNAADYEVSVANAKLSNADAAAFKRLREAKAKEDAKLAADLEHRLGLIRSDTSRTQEEIAKLVILLGQEDPDFQFDLAKERDKRMLAALVEAKARLNVPPPPPEK